MFETPWFVILARVFGVAVLIAVLIVTFMPLRAKAETLEPAEETFDPVTITDLLARVEARQEEQVTYAEETRSLLSEAIEMLGEYMTADTQLKTWNMALQAFSAGLLVVVIFAVTWGN